MVVGRLIAVLLCLPALVSAKPILLSSEETHAQICRDAAVVPARRISACRMVLDIEAPTRKERAGLLVSLGDALATLRETDAALVAYDEAASLDPTDPQPLAGAGWVHWDADAYARSSAAFEASLARHPTPGALAGLGSAWYRGGLAPLDAAIARIEAALAIDPDYAWALRERGWILHANNRGAEAEADFRAALALDALDWNAHYGLSRALSDRGAFEEALASVTAAIDADDRPPQAYGQRAYLLRRLDRNAAAIAEAEIAIRLAPDWSNGHTQKALAQQALGRRWEAIETFRAALAAGVEDAFLLHWYADTLSNDGQMADALAIIDRALARPDSDHHDLTLKAFITLHLEDFAGALAAADGALAIDPSLPYPHYYAAVSLINSGRLADGMGRFDEAMALGLEPHMVGSFAADLIAAGAFVEAIRLRSRY